MIAQVCECAVHRVVRITGWRDLHRGRAFFDPGEMIRQRIPCRRGDEQRNGHGGQAAFRVTPEGRTVSHVVVVAGGEKFLQSLVQAVRGRHVDIPAGGGPAFVPRIENRLFPQASPQPGQVAAIPAGDKGRQVIPENSCQFFLGRDHESVGGDSGNAPGKFLRQGNTNARARVKAVDAESPGSPSANSSVAAAKSSMLAVFKLSSLSNGETVTRRIRGNQRKLLPTPR
jgi:hypothetical protein